MCGVVVLGMGGVLFCIVNVFKSKHLIFVCSLHCDWFTFWLKDLLIFFIIITTLTPRIQSSFFVYSKFKCDKSPKILDHSDEHSYFLKWIAGQNDPRRGWGVLCFEFLAKPCQYATYQMWIHVDSSLSEQPAHGALEITWKYTLRSQQLLWLL